MKRRYFDNAATSSPKPEGVLRAMVDYATRLGGSPGRGAYFESREAGRLMWECRERIRALINGESADHVVFALNTSDALNLAIKGLVLHRLARDPRATAHIITTWLDHNSVLRPINALIEMFPGRVTQTRIRPDEATGLIDADEVRRAIRSGGRADTVLVAVNHASNVTGAVQDIAAIGRVCRELDVPFLVDGAQSLGHIPVDVRAMSIDLLAFPGHKGLLGPTGTGGLYLRPGMERLVNTVREGGTGSRSDEDVQPSTLPDKYEPGSQNAIGLIGLSEGVRFLQEFEHAGLRGIEAVALHERELIAEFLQGIAPGHEMPPGLRLLGSHRAGGRIGVFTVVHEGIDHHALAAVLESEFGLLTRAGVHCAPLAHQMLARESANGGGCRFSLGPFLSIEDVKFATRSLAQVCESLSITN